MVALTDSGYITSSGSTHTSYRKFCGGSFHLHIILSKAIFVLGLSSYYHDSAAAILRDGEIVAAAQEERFTRLKHDSAFPRNAISYCLRECNIGINDVDHVVFYDKPWIKFERIIATYLMYAPHGIKSYLKAMPLWIKKKFLMRQNIKKELAFKGEILFSTHHASHAASAFYPSPFESSAILTLDGVGEWETVTIARGEKDKIDIIKEIIFPHSIGLLYSAFTYYTGFKVNSGEYKLMGLAPYGEPKYVDMILKELIDLKEDGSFKLNMRYFNYCAGLTMTNNRFHRLFGGEPRKPESTFEKKHMDLAKSIQTVTENIIERMAKYAFSLTGEKNLCISGGVALNSVANGKLLTQTPFNNIWIQPAASDAGGALGAAYNIWYEYLHNERRVKRNAQKNSFLGPSFSDEEIEGYLTENAIACKRFEPDMLLDWVADRLVEGKIIAWFQGRMEFGPRALGNRSILADPRKKNMQSIINKKVKFRESFRPFAMTVIRERLFDFFDFELNNPYMLFVLPLKKEARIYPGQELTGFDRLRLKLSDIPAVTHVDYSTRLQTLKRENNPIFYDLLMGFYEKTGCPALINTSFNVRGEPIVCTPDDAYRCFLKTNIDYLIMGDFILDRDAQKKERPESANATGAALD